MIARGLSSEKLLALQKQAFEYFLHEANPENGLIADKTQENSPASVAAVGLALTAYPVGVENGLMTRGDAVNRTLTTLRFFCDAPQSADLNATGYNGFFYHFLDMKTGRRANDCELSTIDTAMLLAGALTAAAYFDRQSDLETEIRARADQLISRANWQWALNDGLLVSHGWKPESGFLSDRWEGYCEALLLYVLALGSPTFPIARDSYDAWTKSYQWRKIFDYEYLHAGPLFIHQLPHVWIDFRQIQDAYMREKGIDYFENSRRATYIQQQYAKQNSRGFVGYDENCWGITASDGPGPAKKVIDGKEREFFGYLARGVPDGPDDGTLAPWSVVTSLPFAPEIVLPALQTFDAMQLRTPNPYGFKATFNLTFHANDSQSFWISPLHFALNQGPIVIMIENFRTGLIWRSLRRAPSIIRGLQQADFTGGWLDKSSGVRS